MNDIRAKIMVVDDDPAMLFTVTGILEDAGYDVCGVEDGYAAVELAGQESFALVFMDISLPGMDGVEAYRRIKTTSPGTPVIMMTGYSFEDMISQAMDEGAYTVLYKPLNIQGLLIAVKDVLDAPCVLAVDEEQDNRESVKSVFEDLGYEVVLAGNETEPITSDSSKRLDIILVNVGTAQTDGFESCRKIVAADPSARVLFVTGHEVNACARQALVAGAFSLLSKPVDPDGMLAIVDSFVGSVDHGATG